MKCRSSYEWDGAWNGCNASTDSLICWPPSPAGVIAYQPCFAELRGILYDTSSEFGFAAGKPATGTSVYGGRGWGRGRRCRRSPRDIDVEKYRYIFCLLFEKFTKERIKRSKTRSRRSLRDQNVLNGKAFLCGNEKKMSNYNYIRTYIFWYWI